MPVKSEYYCKVKPVCDYLAVLASQCREKEFVERFDFLEALCKSWAPLDYQQNVTLSPTLGIVTQADDTSVNHIVNHNVTLSPSSGIVTQADDTSVSHNNLLLLCEVDTVRCSADNVSLPDEETLLTDKCSKELNTDCVQSEIGNCLSTVACKLQNVFQDQGMRDSVQYKNCASVSQCEQRTSVCVATNGRINKCPYVCCFCYKRFKSCTKLVKHLKCHNYCSAPVKSTEFPTVKVDRNVIGAGDLELLACKHCSKQFRTRARLRSHVRSRHKVVQHVCPQCGNRCNSARELRAHLRCSHTASTNKYSCDVCGERFGRSRDLRDHQLSHCGFQSSTGSATRAKSITNSKRSLQCKDCDADSFRTWRSFMVHRRTRHDDSFPLTCSHCSHQFLYASDLRKHERRHTGQRPHVCTECGKGFIHLEDLEVHGRAHRGEVPLTCSVCNKWMSSMTGLRAHMRIHRPNAPLNVCTICDRRFSYLSSFRAHMKRHHTTTAKNTSKSECWRCLGCSAEFSDPLLLEHHVVSCRTTTTKSRNENSSDPTRDSTHNEAMCLVNAKSQQSVNETQSEVCSSQLCNKSLECNGTATENPTAGKPESTNPNVPVNSTDEPATNGEQCSSELRHWQQKYPDRKIEPHTCTTCGKQFLQSVQLRKHMIKHASADDENGVEFPYTCFVCRRHFLFANDLRRHLITHSNDRPYSCVICTRPFKREDDLTKHLKTHGDVRPYKCEECLEPLESSSKLRKHMRKVHGERFECTQCRVFFAKRSLLSKHKHELHSADVDNVVVGVLPYMCDRCGKSFCYEADLRNHMYSSHSRRRAPALVCTWCNRQFSSTSHLASHERIHTGDRPFTCDTCGKQFTQSGSLNVHRRTHVEPQPFPCHVCGQRFASKQYAKKHLAMRHPNITTLRSDVAFTLTST